MKRQLDENASQQVATPLTPRLPRLSDEALGKKKLRECFFDQCYILVDAAEIILPQMNDSIVKEAGSFFNDGESSISERSTNSLNLNEEPLEHPSPSDVINVSDDNSLLDPLSPLPLTRGLLCSSFKDLIFGNTDDALPVQLSSFDSLESGCGSDDLGASEPRSELRSEPSEAALVLSCFSRVPFVCLSDATLLTSICRDVSVVLERLPDRLYRRHYRPKSAHPWLCFDSDRICAAASDNEPDPPPPPSYAAASPLQEVELPDEAAPARHADRLFDSIDLNAQETVTDAFLIFDFDAQWKRVETTKVEVSLVTC